LVLAILPLTLITIALTFRKEKEKTPPEDLPREIVKRLPREIAKSYLSGASILLIKLLTNIPWLDTLTIVDVYQNRTEVM